MNKRNFSIAIDGPVCSGKGTLAIALANKINAAYIYTGAMYRQLALACSRKNIDTTDEEKVLEVLTQISIEIKQTEDGIRAILDREDVSDEIFQPDTSKLVPVVAAFPKIRKEMVLKQRRMAEEAVAVGKNVIMEGRDITTDVIPDADVKIYLTADVKKRAERRFNQLLSKGVDVSFDDVLKDLKERDRRDTQRKASPLRVAKDAMVIDTTNDSIAQTVDKVVKILKEKNLL